MKRFWFTVLLCLGGVAVAVGITAISGLSSLTNQQEEIKSTTNALWSYVASLLSGEDTTNSVFRVEQQFSYNGYKAADTQIKASAGFVHTVICAGTDATATAGTIILYDNTAESGTKIWQWDVQAVAITSPVTVILDTMATTGLYLGFTTTADVACTVSYR